MLVIIIVGPAVAIKHKFSLSDPDKKLDIILFLENSLQNMLPTVNVFVSSTIEELFHEHQTIKNVLTPLGSVLYIAIS
jgi:hypothetical protein